MCLVPADSSLVLELGGSDPFIETVPGRGYRFVPIFSNLGSPAGATRARSSGN